MFGQQGRVVSQGRRRSKFKEKLHFSLQRCEALDRFSIWDVGGLFYVLGWDFLGENGGFFLFNQKPSLPHWF